MSNSLQLPITSYQFSSKDFLFDALAVENSMKIENCALKINAAGGVK